MSDKKINSSKFISSDKTNVNNTLLNKLNSIKSILESTLKLFIKYPIFTITMPLKAFIHITIAILNMRLVLTNNIYSSNKEDSKGVIAKIYKMRYINKEGVSSFKLVDNKLKISVEKSKVLLTQLIKISNIALNSVSKAEQYLYYALLLFIVIGIMSYIPGINMNNLEMVKSYLLSIFSNNKIIKSVLNKVDMKKLLSYNYLNLIKIFKKASIEN